MVGRRVDPVKIVCLPTPSLVAKSGRAVSLSYRRGVCKGPEKFRGVDAPLGRGARTALKACFVS